MVLGLTVSPGAVLNPCTSCVNQWRYYPISQMVKWGLKEVRTFPGSFSQQVSEPGQSAFILIFLG